MGHYVGKIDFNSLIGTRIMEIEHDGTVEKGVFVPISENGIVRWKGELQLWFRAFAYREPKSRFTHFIMKFVPRSSIKKMSAAQLEKFANTHIGGMMKSDRDRGGAEEIGTDEFISENI